MRKEVERVGGPIVFSLTGIVSCDFVAPISCIRRVWVNRTADGSIEHAIFDAARFVLSPMVGVWAGADVSRRVKEYSQSARKTEYEGLDHAGRSRR
eukprot:5615288-Lingulodinium_polyedra.AAC.1